MIRFISPSLIADSNSLDKAFALFDCILAAGNDIAAHRVSELRKLAGMLAGYASVSRQEATEVSDTRMATTTSVNVPQHPGTTRSVMQVPIDGERTQLHVECAALNPQQSGLVDLTNHESGFGEDMTAEQILALAESMNIEETDWLGLCEQACIV